MTYGSGTGMPQDVYTADHSASGDPAAAAAAAAAGLPSPLELSRMVVTPGLTPNVDMYVMRIGRYPDR